MKEEPGKEEKDINNYAKLIYNDSAHTKHVDRTKAETFQIVKSEKGEKEGGLSVHPLLPILPAKELAKKPTAAGSTNHECELDRQLHRK